MIIFLIQQMLWEKIYNMASLGDSFAVDAYLLVTKFFEFFFSSKLGFDLRNEERFWTFLQVLLTLMGIVHTFCVSPD